MNTEWDLSIYYQSFSDPKIEEDFASLDRLMKESAGVLQSADLSDTEKLKAFAEKSEQISALVEALGNYAQLTLSVDATNQDAEKMSDRLMQKSVELTMLNSSFVRFVASVDQLEEMIDSDAELKKIGFSILQSKKEAAHLVPESMEQWVLRLTLSGSHAFSQLRDKLDATLEVDYRDEKLPLSAVRAKAYDSDAAVRKSAYEAEIASYKKMEIPMAACLNSIKAEAQTMSELENYPSVLNMTLENSNMKQETLDSMLAAMDEALPKFREYLRKKGELLGHKNGLPFYDLFAPVTIGNFKPPVYTIEQAEELIAAELGKFSPDLAAFVRHAFENRWIDMYPKAGKSGGAFCAEAHSKRQSRVMTNFAGSFSDVSTIAHELGHAWHNEQMNDLPYAMTGAPMPLAETASIFNETLLANAARAKASEEEAFTLLENDLMESTQVIVDIYSRFLFEKQVIETRKDHSMSVEELKNAMLDAQDKTYGDGLDPQVRHPYMWACKSHYYSAGYNFYNFPYAFGHLFGKGIYARYLEKGPSFAADYNKLLSICGSMMVEDVAASIGIDVTSIDFWRTSLKVITDEIDTFVALANQVLAKK